MHGDVSVFDRFASLYDLVMPAADAGSLAAGLSLAERDVNRVIDVAGGSGRGVRAVDAPERVVVDAARGMCEQARGRGIEAIQGDATELPVTTDAADAVLIVDALHHVPDRERALAEATRVLAPGGVLVVADFDPTTVRSRGLILAERLVGFDSQFVTPDRLGDEMRDLGLSVTVAEEGFGYVVGGVVPSTGTADCER